MSSTHIFVLAIVALAMMAGTVNTWIRARHGLPTGRRGRLRGRDESTLEDQRRIELLSSENGQLKGQISRLEERISVLERIATDPVRRLDDEIDRLR